MTVSFQETISFQVGPSSSCWIWLTSRQIQTDGRGIANSFLTESSFVPQLISSDADGAIQRAGRFRVENGSSDEVRRPAHHRAPYHGSWDMAVSSLWSSFPQKTCLRGAREGSAGLFRALLEGKVPLFFIWKVLLIGWRYPLKDL